MALNFDKLGSGNGGSKIIEPRKIFTTLSRNPRFRRPSDEQGEVLDGWFPRRDRKDNTLKMNTGSGKTLVGLLALQSSLNEGVFPGVYVSADNYLVAQVLKEAADLGVAAIDDPDDAEFLSGKAILVINIWKLVNGRSVFGVGTQGVRIPIGALIVDDAHACLATVGDQFSIKLTSDHPIYKGLLAMFHDELAQQSRAGLLDLEAGDPQAIMPVPFWAWMSLCDRAHQREWVVGSDGHRGATYPFRSHTVEVHREFHYRFHHRALGVPELGRIPAEP